MSSGYANPQGMPHEPYVAGRVTDALAYNPGGVYARASDTAPYGRASNTSPGAVPRPMEAAPYVYAAHDQYYSNPSKAAAEEQRLSPTFAYSGRDYPLPVNNMAAVYTAAMREDVRWEEFKKFLMFYPYGREGKDVQTELFDWHYELSAHLTQMQVAEELIRWLDQSKVAIRRQTLLTSRPRTPPPPVDYYSDARLNGPWGISPSTRPHTGYRDRYHSPGRPYVDTRPPSPISRHDYAYPPDPERRPPPSYPPGVAPYDRPRTPPPRPYPQQGGDDVPSRPQPPQGGDPAARPQPPHGGDPSLKPQPPQGGDPAARTQRPPGGNAPASPPAGPGPRNEARVSHTPPKPAAPDAVDAKRKASDHSVTDLPSTGKAERRGQLLQDLLASDAPLGDGTGMLLQEVHMANQDNKLQIYQVLLLARGEVSLLTFEGFPNKETSVVLTDVIGKSVIDYKANTLVEAEPSTKLRLAIMINANDASQETLAAIPLNNDKVKTAIVALTAPIPYVFTHGAEDIVFIVGFRTHAEHTGPQTLKFTSEVTWFCCVVLEGQFEELNVEVLGAVARSRVSLATDRTLIYGYRKPTKPQITLTHGKAGGQLVLLLGYHKKTEKN